MFKKFAFLMQKSSRYAFYLWNMKNILFKMQNIYAK